MQKFTPIGATVAVIMLPDREKTAKCIYQYINVQNVSAPTKGISIMYFYYNVMM